MTPVEDVLRERFRAAIGAAFGSQFADDPMIKPADPKFADYQCNAALALARRLARPPRETAEEIVRYLNIADICDPPQIAGPGFINLRLAVAGLARRCAQLAADSAALRRGGVDRMHRPQIIIVDYAGPNIAKEMHVGHLRSAIIGDAIARTLEFLGHTVIRQNHVGDFGTQFGMLIRQARDLALDNGRPAPIADLDAYYKQAAQRDRADPQFARETRQAVLALQSGETQTLRLWQWIRDESRRHCCEIFHLLDLTLTDADERGESFYKDRLPALIERLKNALEFGGGGADADPTEASAPQHSGQAADEPGAETSGSPAGRQARARVDPAGEPRLITRPFLADSQGALCVFLPGYVDKDKNPLPLIVRKSDGAYLYATTDLAALYFRIQEVKKTPAEQAPLHCDWRAERVIYVTDSRQARHFAMIFDTIRAARWDINPVTGRPVSLEHAAFGSILGEDGKPFQTRAGESVKLRDLLEEAIQKSAQVVARKNPGLPEPVRRDVARAVGIGAIKYGDLRQDRTGDYAFSWRRMLALEGNTGPYLQYTYARIQSIFRKAGLAAGGSAQAGRSELEPLPDTLILESPAEIALAKRLLLFAGVVAAVARDLAPHYLCSYLYDLCVEFSAFYEACPVLQAPGAERRCSRLILCQLAAGILRVGLRDLLGIAVLEEM